MSLRKLLKNTVDNYELTSLVAFATVTLGTSLIYNNSSKKKSSKKKRLSNIVAGTVHLAQALYYSNNQPTPSEGDTVALKYDLNLDDIHIFKDEKYDSYKNDLNEYISLNLVLETNYRINSISGDGNIYTLTKSIFINNVQYIFVILDTSDDSNYSDDYAFKIIQRDEDKFDFMNYKLREFNKDDTDFGWEIVYEKEELVKESDVTDLRRSLVTKLNKTGIRLWDTAAFFSYITAFSHYGSAILYNDSYVKQLESKKNIFRWIEYSITSPMMLTSLANGSGVLDYNDLINIFVLTSVTNWFGYSNELIIDNDKPLTKIIFFMAGGVCFIVPWYTILEKYRIIYDTYDDKTLEDLKKSNKTFYDILTLYSPLALFTLGSLYFTFPAIHLNQMLNSDKYTVGEDMYIGASLLSKSTLNAFNFFLGNRPPIVFTPKQVL